MSFFDRLSNGWKLSMSSFSVLKKNKQLIIFPILSGAALILIMATFAIGALGANGWDFDNIQETSSVTTYALMFIYYVVNYFIIIFFNMALTHCTRLYFQGEEPTIGKGINFSMSRLGAIFSWAVFAATVGTILRAIQENSGLVGKIITGIIGIVWSIATFFVVPVIAYEDLGPIAAFKRSGQLMKQKWGESLGATFSFGIIQFLAVILVGAPLFFIGSLFHILAGIILAVLGVFLVISVMSAAHTIFISAVYHNITDQPVKDFENETLDGLFIQK
ncbi:MAG: hypothetical protein H7Y00_06015 [Fimbriimonadaceae bacterium]|nr:hypothetical protein [Chitinophagales bacterium]